MSDPDIETFDNKNNLEKTKLYSIRWWIVVLICLLNVDAKISLDCFGIANDILVAYFDISYIVVDWFTLTRIPVVSLACIPLSWGAQGETLRFRRLIILSSSCFVLMSTFNVIAVSWPSSYPLIIIGNILAGVSTAITICIPTVFAIMWFPDHQVGTAMSLMFASGRIGSLLAFVIPSHILYEPCKATSPSGDHEKTFSFALKNSSCLEEWFVVDHNNLIIYFAVLFSIFLFVFICIVILATDEPHLPPTIAQALLRQRNDEVDKNLNLKKQFASFLKQVKDLYTDEVFNAAGLLLASLSALSLIQTTLSGEIFRKIFSEVGQGIRPNILTGYVLVIYQTMAVIGALCGGFIVNHFSNLKVMIISCFTVCVLSSIVLTVGYYLKNIVVICIANVAFGAMDWFGCIVLYEVCCQHTYPTNVTFVMLHLTIYFMIGQLIFVEFERLLLVKTGPIGVFVAMGIMFLLSLLLSIFIKPKRRRFKAEKTASLDFSDVIETSNLLQECNK